MAAEAFFLDASEAGRSAAGRRFCIRHAAHGEVTRGLVLYVHPFAEEMNKSRRMAALQSRALAERGFEVLQIDLHGCGDSSGDFGDATWQGWLDDIALACQWLRQRADAPLWLWGLRVGCLLTCEAAQRIPSPCNFVFWQPSVSGRTSLAQFLRLKAVAEMLAGDARGVAAALRGQLGAGTAVEVAGYTLAAALAAGLDSASLRPPKGNGGRVVWLELAAASGPALMPASMQAIEGWKRAGYNVDSAVVEGPSFWQATEIEEAPQLVAATVRAVAAAISV